MIKYIKYIVYFGAVAYSTSVRHVEWVDASIITIIIIMKVSLLTGSSLPPSPRFDFRGVPLGAKQFFQAEIQGGAGAIPPSPGRHYVVVQ